jgi:hypothetical protein
VRLANGGPEIVQLASAEAGTPLTSKWFDAVLGAKDNTAPAPAVATNWALIGPLLNVPCAGQLIGPGSE